MPFAELLRLDRPPVQIMRATIFFRAQPRLSTLSAGRAYGLWRSEYSTIRESHTAPPVFGFDGASDGESDGELDENLPPMPFYAFEAEHKAILIQGDRLAITWTADSDSDQYPTFRVLGEELIGKYNEFSSITREEFGSILAATHVEIRYINTIVNQRADQYIAALLSGFSASNVNVTPNRDSVIFTDHWHDEESQVWARVESGESEESEDTELDITTRRTILDDDVRGGLELTHRTAIKAFVRSTSDSMRKEWGEA